MITARQMAAGLNAESSPSDVLVMLLGHLKALHWFHWTAHWQTAGDYGDHLLFERLKDGVEEEIDPLAEKIVGYYGAGNMGPAQVMEHEHDLMDAEQEPDLVARALQMELDLQDTLHEAYAQLDEMDELPMGLDDLIMSMSSTHDTHIFLLQQRNDGSKRAGTDSLEKSWAGQSSFSPMRHAEEDEAWDEWEEAGLLTDGEI